MSLYEKVSADMDKKFSKQYSGSREDCLVYAKDKGFDVVVEDRPERVVVRWGKDGASGTITPIGDKDNSYEFIIYGRPLTENDPPRGR